MTRIEEIIPKGQSLALVVLSSRQLWPNLYSIAALNKLGLSDVCIYHTDSLDNSKRPATSLARLCQELNGGLHLHHLNDDGGHGPRHVADQIDAWRSLLPDKHFVLNATGGLKPMMAGMLRYIGEENVSVIYREITGQWYQFVKSTNPSGFDLRPIGVDESEVNKIDVVSLIASQYNAHMTIRIRSHPPAHVDLDEITRIGNEVSWDWREIITKTGSRLKPGFLFEAYISAGLKQLGIENMACNFEVKSEEGKILQEVDVVAMHSGQLLLIDLKLRNEEEETLGNVESITSQIRQASETRRAMGGIGGKMVLVRPNRKFDDALRRLCRMSQIELIEGPDCREIFTRLAGLFNVNVIPEPIANIETALNEYHQRTKAAPLSFDGYQAIKISHTENKKPINYLDVDQIMAHLDKEALFLRDPFGRLHIYRKINESFENKLECEEWLRAQYKLPRQKGAKSSQVAYRIKLSAKRTYAYLLVQDPKTVSKLLKSLNNDLPS